MSDERAPQAKFELLQADDYSQYLLRDKREIMFVIKQLIAKRSLVTAYFGDRGRFMLSSIVGLSLDEQEIYLDVGKDEELNKQAMAHGNLLCITQLDKVKIQFLVDHPINTSHAGYPAFKGLVPDVLLRLQRREYYRLTAPSSHSLTCQIPLEAAASQRVEARVIDISGGGIAVVVPPRDVEFAADKEFAECRLDLPEFGPITAKLRVRNLFKLTSRNGVDMLRAGCQFVDLSPTVANAIQRYILKVERERKARDLGE